MSSRKKALVLLLALIILVGGVAGLSVHSYQASHIPEEDDEKAVCFNGVWESEGNGEYKCSKSGTIKECDHLSLTKKTCYFFSSPGGNKPDNKSKLVIT